LTCYCTVAYDDAQYSKWEELVLQRITIYFSRKEHGDLKKQIGDLGKHDGSQFHGRSESEIARMILAKGLQRASGASKKK
jgi:hypothetical protein